MKLSNLSDDHHPAPTFTPPELPKRVHVRGVTAGKRNKRSKNKTEKRSTNYFFSFLFVYLVLIHMLIIRYPIDRCVSHLIHAIPSSFKFISNILHLSRDPCRDSFRPLRMASLSVDQLHRFHSLHYWHSPPEATRMRKKKRLIFFNFRYYVVEQT